MIDYLIRDEQSLKYVEIEAASGDAQAASVTIEWVIEPTPEQQARADAVVATITDQINPHAHNYQASVAFLKRHFDDVARDDLKDIYDTPGMSQGILDMITAVRIWMRSIQTRYGTLRGMIDAGVRTDLVTVADYEDLGDPPYTSWAIALAAMGARHGEER